jgi:hypothetical protein
MLIAASSVPIAPAVLELKPTSCNTTVQVSNQNIVGRIVSFKAIHSLFELSLP